MRFQELLPQYNLPELRIGEVFHEYTLNDILAWRPRCVVFRALKGNEWFLIKFFELNESNTDLLNRWNDKIERLKTTSPGFLILPCEIGAWSKGAFLVTKYIEGKSLDSFIASRSLTLTTGMLLIKSISELVDQLHKIGIPHMNLKPSNVILTPQGDLYLRDPLELTVPIPYTDMRAPELISSSKKFNAEVVDVFGLGVIFYAILTGALPIWRGPTPLKRGWPYVATPRSLNPEISIAMEAICLKSLSFNPLKRYKSVAEFNEDISRVLEEKTVAAKTPSIMSKLISYIWRSPGIVAVWIAFILLFGGISGLSIYTVIDLQEDLWRARARSIEAACVLGQKEEALNCLRLTVAWKRPYELKETAIGALLLPEIRRISTYPISGVSDIIWSPSGRYLLLNQIEKVSEGFPLGTCSVIDIKTGRTVYTVKWNPLRPLPCFHPFEDWFVIPGEDGQTLLYVVDERTPLWTFQAEGPMCFSPDGQKLAIGSETVRVFSIVERRLIGEKRATGLISWLDSQTVVLRKDNGLEFWRPAQNESMELIIPSERIIAVSPDGKWSLWAWIERRESSQWFPIRLRKLPNGELVGEISGLQIPYIPYPARFDRMARRLFIPDPQQMSLLKIFRIPTLNCESVLSIPNMVFDFKSRGYFIAEHGTYKWIEAKEIDASSWLRPLTCDFSPDDRFIIISFRDRKSGAEIWEIDAAQRVARLPGTFTYAWCKTDSKLAVGKIVERENKRKDFYLEEWALHIPSFTLRFDAPIRNIKFFKDRPVLTVNGKVLTIASTDYGMKGKLEIISENGYDLLPSQSKWYGVSFISEANRRFLRITKESTEDGTISIPISGRLVLYETDANLEYLFITDLLIPLEGLPPGKVKAGVLTRWRLKDGKRVGSVELEEEVNTDQMAVDADGNYIALISADGKKVFIWKTNEEKLEPAYTFHIGLGSVISEETEKFSAVCFSHDGEICFVGTTHGRLIAWSMRNGVRLWQRVDISAPIVALDSSKAWETVGAINQDGIVELIRNKTGQSCARWSCNTAQVSCMKFSNDGYYLAIGTNTGILKIVDVEDLRQRLAKFGLGW